MRMPSVTVDAFSEMAKRETTTRLALNAKWLHTVSAISQLIGGTAA
jgi:hypothetical protein